MRKRGIHMSNNTIITIGRQYGSGGKAIGEQLAKELGISQGTVSQKKAA